MRSHSRALSGIPVASARLIALLASFAFVFLAGAAPAPAHEAQLRGLVLGVIPASGEVVLRYDSFLDVPGAITTFKLQPRSLAGTLKVGQRIAATADADARPWTLRRVTVLGSESVLGAGDATSDGTAGVLRNVAHLQTGALVPDTQFVDQDGRSLKLRDFGGQNVVLAFVYTRCRDARECPLISAKFGRLQEKVRDQKAHLVEVTLDPAYDRPAVLKTYGKLFAADASRWSLLTGDPERVLDFAAQFDVTAFPDPRIGLIHSERTVLIDRYGVVRQLIDESSWTPEELAAQLRANERLSSNPFARLNLWLSAKAVAICGNSVAGFSGIGDLLVVFAIFAVFGYILWRIARGMARSAT